MSSSSQLSVEEVISDDAQLSYLHLLLTDIFKLTPPPSPSSRSPFIQSSSHDNNNDNTCLQSLISKLISTLQTRSNNNNNNNGVNIVGGTGNNGDERNRSFKVEIDVFKWRILILNCIFLNNNNS